MKNYLSIDFESWVFPDLPSFRALSSQEKKNLDNGYVIQSAEEILRILKENNQKITFFVVGQLYDWYPEVIEKIAGAGHEIAYHSHSHDILKSKKDLQNSLKKSAKFIKKFHPLGFRAPLLSTSLDYYPILKEYGFSYDSSVYDSYNTRENISGIEKIPVSRFSGLPFGSGYFTALLRNNISFIYRYLNNRNIPVISFVHNWQISKPKNASFPNFPYLLKRPAYLPYTFEIKKVFQFLLGNYSFCQMRELVSKKRK